MKIKFQKPDYFRRRLIMCIIGVLLSGVAVGFCKRAIFGVDPFQSMMAGLEALIPISFGTLYIIVNAILLVFGFFADKHYIGLATLINLFLLGYVVDGCKAFLFYLFPDLGLPGRIICLVAGILIACVAASLYFTADLGVSTYDAVALIITQTWKKGKFRYVRICTDFTCVALGVIFFLLSGEDRSGLWAVVGVGTVITALFMGPLIDVLNIHMSQPLLKRGKK